MTEESPQPEERPVEKRLDEALDALTEARRVILKYQSRYHGAPHAQRDYDDANAVLFKIGFILNV